MDIDKVLDAISGWSLQVFELVDNHRDPAKIIDLCKKINTEGRKLESRQSGIKRYTRKLKEAIELSESVKKHSQEVDTAYNEFRRKYGVGINSPRDRAMIGFKRCAEKTECRYNFDNSSNLLGETFYGGRYQLMNGRELIQRYASFMTNEAKEDIKFIQRAITEIRAASQLIMNAMEKITKLPKEKRDSAEKIKSLYAPVKKDAVSMYTTSRLGESTVGKKTPRIRLKDTKFRSPEGRSPSSVHLDLFETIDYIKDHLKNCKKKSLQ